MLPNEEFALACRAKYEEQGLVVDARNGEFVHSPLTRHECDTGYYLTWGDHQHQGLLQSRDLGKCCFWVGDSLKWLKECDYWPDNFFELWDIYEKYSSMQSRQNSEKINAEKDERGKSVNAVKGGKKGAEKTHAEKDENGKSVNAVEGGKKAHAEKDENGKSVLGLKNAKKLHEEKDERGKSVAPAKGGKKLHEEKDENGKSVVGVKAGKTTSSQIWESTIDGFRSNPGTVARHNKARGWDPNARIRIS